MSQQPNQVQLQPCSDPRIPYQTIILKINDKDIELVPVLDIAKLLDLKDRHTIKIQKEVENAVGNSARQSIELSELRGVNMDLLRMWGAWSRNQTELLTKDIATLLAQNNQLLEEQKTWQQTHQSILTRLKEVEDHLQALSTPAQPEPA